MAIVRVPSLAPIGAFWTGCDLVALAPYGASALFVLWWHKLAWELSRFRVVSAGAGFIFWQENFSGLQCVLGSLARCTNYLRLPNCN